MTVHELIEKLEALEKVHGKDTPVILEIAGLPQDLEEVYVNTKIKLILLGGGN